MRSTRVFYICVVSFIVGVAYGSLRKDVGIVAYIVLVIVLLYVSAWRSKISLVIKGSVGTFYSSTLCIMIALALFAVGVFRYYMAELTPQRTALDTVVGQQMTYEGLIVEEADVRETGVKYVVDIGTTKLITTADFYPRFEYGDKVIIRGIVTVPEVIEEDAGKSFNYPGYLAKDGIFYVLKHPRLTRVSQGNGAWLQEKLFTFKRAFLTHIHHAVGDPEASLAGGLVVGAKQSLGKALEDDFRRAGIIHIVVLSGFNITIVAVAIMKVLSFLPQSIGAFFGVMGLILFALLTGGTATVVRSTLMTLLVIAAGLTRREYDIIRGLSLAGFCMVMHNPLILMFDPSFQLSFLATLGLIMLSPYIKPYAAWLPLKFGFQEIAVSTVATQIFVLPYLLYQMGQLSVIGLVVNFLVLPLIPLTMLCVFLTGMFGFVLTSVSFLCGYCSFLLLAYELYVVDIFSHISFASVSISYFPLWLLIMLYVVYGCVLVYLKKRGARRTPGSSPEF